MISAMVHFRKRELHNKRELGEKLQNQRKRLNLNLEKISEKINVPLKYLVALENGDYKNLPANIYSKNFLKKFLRTLKLPEEPLIEQFLEERNSFNILNQNKGADNFVARVAKRNLLDMPKIIRTLSVILVVAALLGYLGFEIKDIVTPPKLAIFEPQDNLVISGSTAVIRGQTEKEARILINNQEVLSDPEGNFEKSLQLQSGINTIKITAKKKHSRENIIYKNILVEFNSK